MRQPDPHWEELASQPFARWVPEDVIKYRAHELRALLNLRAERPPAVPAEVEVGSNRGRFLRGLCKGRPETSFYGVELKRGLVDLANRRLARHQATNGCAINADARLFLAVYFGAASLQAVYVLFPDPWWKKRHAKRRIIDPEFLDLVERTLVPGGHLVIKTDVASYGRRVAQMLREHAGYALVALDSIPGHDTWEPTTRERHCLEDGLRVHGVFARKVSPAACDAPPVSLPE